MGNDWESVFAARINAAWHELRTPAPVSYTHLDVYKRQLQQQRAQLQGTYQQKLQVFKADYPEMQQLKGQMDDLDKQITLELRNICLLYTSRCV